MASENLPPNVIVDFNSFLSCDNDARKQAEARYHQLVETQPAVVSMQLMQAIVADPTPAVRELCAVLARRHLPRMLPNLQTDICEAVKAGLLQALGAEATPTMRRKLCDLIGRIGCEYHTGAGWPELTGFIGRACGGEPRAHASALSILAHMSAALVETWGTCGTQIEGMLVGALAPGTAPEVQAAALCALTALMRSCAERELHSPEERKRCRTIAASLSSAMPKLLAVLEASINACDQATSQRILDDMVQVAEAQPKMYKGVLGQVVDGMCTLAASEALTSSMRISCAELLLTLAEGAPKMCARLAGGFAPKALGALLPMMLRIGEDSESWEAAEPEDGLNDGDDDDDECAEAVYAAQGLERLCDALGGDEVTPLLLAHLSAALSQPQPTWQQHHAALVAVAQVATTTRTTARHNNSTPRTTARRRRSPTRRTTRSARTCPRWSPSSLAARRRRSRASAGPRATRSASSPTNSPRSPRSTGWSSRRSSPTASPMARRACRPPRRSPR